MNMPGNLAVDIRMIEWGFTRILPCNFNKTNFFTAATSFQCHENLSPGALIIYFKRNWVFYRLIV